MQYCALSCHNISSTLIYKRTEWTTPKYSFLCIYGLSDKMSVAETVQHQTRKEVVMIQFIASPCHLHDLRKPQKKCNQGSQCCSQTSQWRPSEYKSKTLVLVPTHPKITDMSNDLPVYSEQRIPQVTVYLILWRCCITCLYTLNKGHHKSQYT